MNSAGAPGANVVPPLPNSSALSTQLPIEAEKKGLLNTVKGYLGLGGRRRRSRAAKKTRRGRRRTGVARKARTLKGGARRASRAHRRH